LNKIYSKDEKSFLDLVLSVRYKVHGLEPVQTLESIPQQTYGAKRSRGKLNSGKNAFGLFHDARWGEGKTNASISTYFTTKGGGSGCN